MYGPGVQAPGHTLSSRRVATRSSILSRLSAPPRSRTPRRRSKNSRARRRDHEDCSTLKPESEAPVLRWRAASDVGPHWNQASASLIQRLP